MHKYEQASENLRHEVDMVKMMGDEDQDFDHHYANHIVDHYADQVVDKITSFSYLDFDHLSYVDQGVDYYVDHYAEHDQ